MVMDAQAYDYMHTYKAGEGFKLYLGQSDEYPILQSNGIVVSPGNIFY